MNSAEPKTTLEFEIKSLDPSKKIIDTVPEIEKQAVELERAIAVEYPGTVVNIRRKEGLPVHLAVQYLIVHINWPAVAAGAEKAAAAFATTEFLKLMKKSFKNVFSRKVESGQEKPVANASPGEAGPGRTGLTGKSARDSASSQKGKSSAKHRK